MVIALLLTVEIGYYVFNGKRGKQLQSPISTLTNVIMIVTLSMVRVDNDHGCDQIFKLNLANWSNIRPCMTIYSYYSYNHYSYNQGVSILN